MRRIFTFLIAILIGTAALTAHAMPANLARVNALSSIPKAYTVYASAPSLAELIKETKPNLTWKHDQDQTMFMWTSKNEQGKRTFTIATAQLYAPSTGAARWVLLSADEKDISGASSIVFKRAIPVITNEQVDKVAGKKSWARVVSVHPDQGTLYEIRYFADPETVAMVMHDPSHGWRFVATFDGAVSYGKGQGMKVAADARWTGNDKAPVEITVIRKHTYERCTQFEEDRYSGTLPATMKSTRAYLVVKEGDTFGELLVKHYGWDNMTKKEERQTVKNLTPQILKLNPGLDPAKLTPGQQIKIPTESGC